MTAENFINRRPRANIPKAEEDAQMTKGRAPAYLMSILMLVSTLVSAPFVLSANASMASTARSVHQATLLGITSSGRVFNLERAPAWLKPNTLVHPLVHPFQSVTPDTLYENAQICDSSIEQCINNWDGGGLGNIQKYYGYGVDTANNMYNWWYEGDVTGAQSWPFTPGTGINDTLNGYAVYKFAAAPNGVGSGYCISQQLFTPGDTGASVNVINCAPSNAQNTTAGKLQYFTFDSIQRLVAVQATNDYVAAYGNGSGLVYVGFQQSSSNGNTVDLVTNKNYTLTHVAAIT